MTPAEFLREEVRAALADAGWSDQQIAGIEDALRPVLDRAQVTALRSAANDWRDGCTRTSPDRGRWWEHAADMADQRACDIEGTRWFPAPSAIQHAAVTRAADAARTQHQGGTA